MKVAVIDLGTNTFHLLIASVGKGTYDILSRDRKAVRIGQQGINKAEIIPTAWDRAIEALKTFKAIIEQNGVTRVFATATSAIRNARNGQALVQKIHDLTGIEIEVISGTREAELIHLGSSKALDLGSQKGLIMDIGGGSIEFIIADQKKRYWLRSFEIGGQRLVEKFHTNDPITDLEIMNLNRFFDEELQALLLACKEHLPNTLIGCSGTFDTLSDIYCAQEGIVVKTEATEHPFTRAAFNQILKDLLNKTRDERLAIPGMIEMRVDMIVVACVLVKYVMEKCELNDIRVSAFALKEGILFQALDQLFKEMND